ncbi:M48 family metallopeptidase [Corallincola spongiicola]|nr:M48 family metallopeptidase [Corallincola spongiicola]
MSMIAGTYYDGESSAQTLATMRTGADGSLQLLAVDSRHLGQCSLAEVTVSPRIGNTPRYIDLPDGGRFETTDNDAIDQWLAAFGRDSGNRFLNFLESHTKFVLASVILVALFCWWMVSYGIPGASKVVAYQLPATVLDHSSETTLALLDRSLLSESKLSDVRQQQLHDLFAPYLPSDSEYTFRVLLRDGGEIGANAFALPDGTLVFTDQMVELVDSDEELLAVLGHEIGHVVERHSLRQTLQGSTVAVIAVLVVGDASAFGDLFAALPTYIISSAYSRDFERDADSYAFEFLKANDLPPTLFADVMRKMMAKHQALLSEGIEEDELPSQDPNSDSWLDYLSSHPPSEERIRQAEQAQ